MAFTITLTSRILPGKIPQMTMNYRSMHEGDIHHEYIGIEDINDGMDTIIAILDSRPGGRLINRINAKSNKALRDVKSEINYRYGQILAERSGMVPI